MAKVDVVGAGPAGCSAAYHLARSGHEVTLFDKAAFPRDKTCGDGISTGALEALAAMGIYPPQLAAGAPEHCAIDRCVVGAPSGKTNVCALGVVGYCVPRYLFDNLLYNAAMGQGCRFERRAVRDLEAFARARADRGVDWVIDARGVYAGDPNAVGMRSYWKVPSAQLSADDRTGIQIYFHDFLGPAYGWIFPVGDQDGYTKLNVGVGMWGDEFRRAKLNLSALMDRFVTENPRARALAEAAVSKDKNKGYYLAMAKRNNRVAQGNILRIGDAANLTDPVTGEGIQNALQSGALVAEAIDLARAPGLAGEAWQRLYDDNYERHFRAGLMMVSLLRFKAVKNALVAAMNWDTRIAETVNAGIVDLVRYHEMVPALMRALRRPKTHPEAAEVFAR